MGRNAADRIGTLAPAAKRDSIREGRIPGGRSGAEQINEIRRVVVLLLHLRNLSMASTFQKFV